MKTSIMDRSKDTLKKIEKETNRKTRESNQTASEAYNKVVMQSTLKNKINFTSKSSHRRSNQQGRTISKLCMIRSHLIRKHMKAWGSINKKKSEKDSKYPESQF